MTTLSSEFLAQSTMPLRPFMGKLMSVITDTAGSLWMLATAEFKQTNKEIWIINILDEFIVYKYVLWIIILITLTPKKFFCSFISEILYQS